MTKDNENIGSSLDALREYGIDVAHLEAGYKSKDAIIQYGKQLRDMRKKADLTQAELAEAADMAQADISRLERGLGKVGPSLEIMSRLADACKHQFSVSLVPVFETQDEEKNEDESNTMISESSGSLVANSRYVESPMKSVNEQFAEMQKKTLESLKPMKNMNAVAAEAFERIARRNYDLMSDLVDYAVAQVKTPTDPAKIQEANELRVAETKAFAEKVNTRAAEYVALASELGELAKSKAPAAAKKKAAAKKTAT